MSSWLNANRNGRQRFSLLLLDEREYYFEDHHAIYFLPRPSQQGVSIQRRQCIEVAGRLKVCSASIVFDPENTRYPITRFPFENVSKIKMFNESGSHQGRFYLETISVVEMKENGFNHPYHFKELDDYDESGGIFVFSFTYSPLRTCLPFICELWEISRIKNKAVRTSRLDLTITKSQREIKFDTSRFADIRETPQLDNAIVVRMITPLVETPGCIMVTNALFYFQPFNDISSAPVFKYYIRDVKSIYKRRYVMSQTGLELLFSEDRSLFLHFDDKKIRDRVYDVLMSQPQLRLDEEHSLQQMQMKWSEGKVSNFEYLTFLNQLGGRSLNDLTQYPVFPWIIADYSSPKLDLEDPKTFRDLSKPIGALNTTRLEAFRQRFAQMPNSPDCPRFMYGSHYSTPGYVLYFLVRVAPEYMLRLQCGKFDSPDRLFSSIERCWASVLKSQADVKELIPEFYQGGCTGKSGRFLNNEESLDLGIKQDGIEVGDVEMPPWAEDSDAFVSKCREALECDYVSQRIHQWIDLIFGYKQTGDEAIKADNLFFYLTYEGAVDMDNIDDEVQKNAYRNQIREFGQTPHKLFRKPHPKRGEVARIARIKPPPPPPIHNELKFELEPETSTRRRKKHGRKHSHKKHHTRKSSKSQEEVSYSRTKSTQSENSTLNSHHSGKKRTSKSRHKRPKATVDRVSSAPVTPLNDHVKKPLKVNLRVNGLEQKDEQPDLDELWNYKLDSPTVDDPFKSSLSDIESLKSSISDIDLLPLPEDLHCGPLEVVDTGAVSEGTDAVRRSNGSTNSVKPAWGQLNSAGFKSKTLNFHRGAITALCLSHDGDMLYSGDADSTLAIYSLKKDRLHRSTSINEGMALSSICVSSDCKNVIIGSFDNHIYVYSIDFARVSQPILAHDSAVSCLGLHGDKLVSGSWDSTVKLWQCRESTVSKMPLVEFIEHETEVKCLSISYDGNMAASGSDYGVLIIWDLRQKSPVRQIHGAHDDEITDVRWSPNDRRIFSCSADGFIKQFDPTTGASSLAIHSDERLSSLRTDGKSILTSGELGDIRLWDIHSRKEVRQYNGLTPDPISCFVVSNDGELFVTGQSTNFSNNICVFKS